MIGMLPLPTSAIIDPVNRCNLSCGLCPTGQKSANYPQSFMNFDTFKRVLGKFPELKSIELYNWGEPFLNSEIFNMIEYAKALKIFVTIHTNFSFKKNDDFFMALAHHGPHSLVISLDGASQDSYSQFRVKGEFLLVISNIKKLKDYQKNSANNMLIMWKFLVNKYNEHEMDRAKAIAKEIGVKIRFVAMSLGDDMVDIVQKNDINERMEKWLPSNKEYIQDRYEKNPRKAIFKGICKQLFETIVINPDGRVFPCCTITNEKNVFGDILNESLEDIWYNEKYEYSRSLFVKNNDIKSRIETICKECRNYEKIEE
jgi:radical SAM protein with 4Fe4S-binding SPASM domain